MRKRRRKKNNKDGYLVLLLLAIIFGLFFFFNTQNRLVTVSIVSKIDDYDYYLESNATNIYQKYYNELEKELSKKEVDEEKYVTLIAKLFTIDFYTLKNKITNKDIGGIQFIHTELKEKFSNEASNTIYKYLKNNLYNNRKQKLPNVKEVNITGIERGVYKNKELNDSNAYQINANIDYYNDYGYQKNISLILIHENNKMVIVEMK